MEARGPRKLGKRTSTWRQARRSKSPTWLGGSSICCASSVSWIISCRREAWHGTAWRPGSASARSSKLTQHAPLPCRSSLGPAGWACRALQAAHRPPHLVGEVEELQRLVRAQHGEPGHRFALDLVAPPQRRCKRAQGVLLRARGSLGNMAAAVPLLACLCCCTCRPHATHPCPAPSRRAGRQPGSATKQGHALHRRGDHLSCCMC